MSQSLAQVYLHIVYSTKHRQAFLTDKAFREQAHSYLAGACVNLNSPAVIVGGVEDHVHILCRFGRTIDISTLIRELKRESSKWIKQQQPRLSRFQWQAGYGAFSVSPSHVKALTNYINDQESHHKTETFQEEFRRLCRKYGIQLDERYAWD